MQLTLIRNTDSEMSTAYRIARVVYAETLAASLRVVEALTSMIYNVAKFTGHDFMEIIGDCRMFESLNANSARHKYLYADSQTRDFQMCVRVAKRMLKGNLADACCGAVRFHRAEYLPDWAVARGYIADIDGLLFYLAGDGDE